MDFGRVLGGFCESFGGVVGAKQLNIQGLEKPLNLVTVLRFLYILATSPLAC